MVYSYEVRISIEGWKRIKKLDKSVVIRVLQKSKVLSDFRNLNNIKQLEGKERGNYRMRVGDIRILFDVDEVNKIVWINDVGFRGSVYRN